MDNFTLSEVCYKNGFKDGQSAPIYILVDSFGICKAVSHSKECLESLMKSSYFIEDVLYIEKFNPDVIIQGSIEQIYHWNYKTHSYE